MCDPQCFTSARCYTGSPVVLVVVVVVAAVAVAVVVVVVVVSDVCIFRGLSSESRQQLLRLKYWWWEPTGLCGPGCALLDAVRFSLLPGKVGTGVVREGRCGSGILESLIAGSHWL